MTVTIVAACSENGVMGVEGRLPWRLPQELKHFQEVTRGCTLIMGRRTYESLPSKHLPGRRIIVVSSQELEECEHAESLPQALALAGEGPVVLAGGAGIYREGFAYATSAVISVVEGSFEGDTYFPPLPGEWLLDKVVEREGFRVEHYSKHEERES